MPIMTLSPVSNFGDQSLFAREFLLGKKLEIEETNTYHLVFHF